MLDGQPVSVALLHVSHQLFGRLVAGHKDHLKWLPSSYKLTIELSKDRGEEPAGWAPVCGEVEGDDLLSVEGRVRCHHTLVPPQHLLPGKTVHVGNQSN